MSSLWRTCYPILDFYYFPSFFFLFFPNKFYSFYSVIVLLSHIPLSHRNSRLSLLSHLFSFFSSLLHHTKSYSHFIWTYHILVLSHYHLILYCLVLSHLISSYLILSCFILSYLLLHHFISSLSIEHNFSICNEKKKWKIFL